MAFDLKGLEPLETDGLEPLDTGPKQLDLTGLQPLDTGGLEPMETAQPEFQYGDTWGDVATKFAKRIIPRFKQSIGGGIQAMAERPPTPAWAMPGDPQFEAAEQQHREIVEAARARGDLPGQELYREATADVMANQPNVESESAKDYAFQISEGFVQMIPMLTVSLLSKSPAAGLTFMAGQVGGHEFGEAREKGRSYDEAMGDTAFNVMAEVLPEKLPLGILMKEGGKFLPRVLKAAGAEFVQEMFTEALQMGYDAGVLDEKTPIDEIWPRLRQAGLVGAGVGAGMATVAHPFSRDTAAGEGGQASAAEVTEFAETRLRELDAKGQLSPREELEREFLQEQRGNVQGLAEAYGVEITDPDTVQTDPGREDLPAPSAGDIASPIPTELIQEGRQVVEDALDTTGGEELQARREREQRDLANRRTERAKRAEEEAETQAVLEEIERTELNTEGLTPIEETADDQLPQREPGADQAAQQEAQAEAPEETAGDTEGLEPVEGEKIAEPDWWTRRTGAERQFVLDASGVKGTASTQWSRLSAENQRRLDSQWGERAPAEPRIGPERVASGAEAEAEIEAQADFAPVTTREDAVEQARIAAEADTPTFNEPTDEAQYAAYRSWIEEQAPETLDKSGGMLNEIEFDERLTEDQAFELVQMFNEKADQAGPATSKERVRSQERQEQAERPIPNLTEAQRQWQTVLTRSGRENVLKRGGIKDADRLSRMSWNNLSGEQQVDFSVAYQQNQAEREAEAAPESVQEREAPRGPRVLINEIPAAELNADKAWSEELSQSGREDLLRHAGIGTPNEADVRRIATIGWADLSENNRNALIEALPTFEVGGVKVYAAEEQAEPAPAQDEVKKLSPESTAAERDAFVAWYRENDPGYDVWQAAEARLGESELVDTKEFKAGPGGRVSGKIRVFKVGNAWTFGNNYDVQGFMGGGDPIGGLNRQFDSQEDALRTGLTLLSKTFTADRSSSLSDVNRRAMGAVKSQVDAELAKLGPAETPSEAAGAPQAETGTKAQQRLRSLRDRVVVVASGMSRTKDLQAGTHAWGGLTSRGIGVDVGEVSGPGVEALADAVVNKKAQIFIDSGAFSLFRRNLRRGEAKALDFDAIFEKYDNILEAIDEANAVEDDVPAPLLVMPDVIGDQAASLALIDRYKNRISTEATFDIARPIIPIQKGELSLQDAYAEIVDKLGTDRFIVGIPANQEAVTMDEFREFVESAGPPRIHFLGAASERRLNPYLEVLAESGIDVDHVSADANILRSSLYGKQTDKPRGEAIVDSLVERAGPEFTEAVTGEPPLRIEDYTEKSIIVRGETKENKDRIKAALPNVRALWNRKAEGWIFPKKREAEVREALADLLKAPRGTSQKGPRQIGENGLGLPLYEDESGVRSYVESGIRVTESVGIRPDGIEIDTTKRGEDFSTKSELSVEAAEAVEAGGPELVIEDEYGGMRTSNAFFMGQQEMAAKAVEASESGKSFTAANSPYFSIEIETADDGTLSVNLYKHEGLGPVLYETGTMLEYEDLVTKFTALSRAASDSSAMPINLPTVGPAQPVLTPDGKRPITKGEIFPKPDNRRVIPKAEFDKYYGDESNPEGWSITKKGADLEFVKPSEARQKLKQWKAVAAKVGEIEDNKSKVIISLFDATGAWSQPYVDAGYTVLRYDNAHGHDIHQMDWFQIKEELAEKGYTIAGVLAAPPCTSFSSAGARWWGQQHDTVSRAWVKKKYGDYAATFYDRPIEYAEAIAADAMLIVDLMDPTDFYAMENPSGRLRRMLKEGKWNKDINLPSLSFDPWHFGDPYTKRTHLWGEMQTDVPLAPVVPVEGSKMHKMSSGDERVGGERSATPEGFSYAFFMANDPTARRLLDEQEKAPAGDSELETHDGIVVETLEPDRNLDPNVERQTFWGRQTRTDPETGLRGIYRVQFDKLLRNRPIYTVKQAKDDGSFVPIGEVRQRPEDENGLEWAQFDLEGNEIGERWHSFATAVTYHPAVDAESEKLQRLRAKERTRFTNSWKQEKTGNLKKNTLGALERRPTPFVGIGEESPDMTPLSGTEYLERFHARMRGEDPSAPKELRMAQHFAKKFAEGAKYKFIAQARAEASDYLGRKVEAGTEDVKLVDEAIELGVTLRAREIISEKRGTQETYDALVDLYKAMPKLASRTSTSVEQQAYSTPVPLAYLAAEAAGINTDTTVYEPAAGNGALVMPADPRNLTLNELNDDRAENLRRVFPGANITSNDSSEWRPDRKFDVVIANPPFGTVKDEAGQTRRFQVDERYETGEIDHAMAMKSLEAMADNGSAVLIVGSVAKTNRSEDARSDAYNSKAKREFYLTLYGEYNVVDHFTVAGEMYERQGAGWPVDVIVIRGRGKSEKVVPAADVPHIYRTWDELSDALQKTALYPRADSAQAGRTRTADRTGNQAAPRPASRDAADRGSGAAAQPSTVRGETEVREPRGVRDGRVDRESVDARLTRPSRRDATVTAQSEEPARRTRPPAVTENARQVAYTPGSRSTAMGTLVPVNMQTSIRDALENLGSKVGSLDSFVADRLGYDVNDIGQYFAAEQVDALALAIDNMESGDGFIIGDQTGIGKGRVVAGVLRYAMMSDRTPIFVTEKPNLYGDMYRDLKDIGVIEMLGREPRILMTNAGEKVTLDEDGKVVLKTSGAQLHNKMLQSIASEGLENHDLIFTTYSQMQTVQGQATVRQSFLDTMGKGAIIVMDESHNAGGTEKGDRSKKKEQAEAQSRAELARSLTRSAHGVLYSSATYAKRPDVMDLYATTDMKLAVSDISDLSAAITKGGVPMQQVVASMLAESGQYIRRERSFDGVVYNSPVVSVDRDTYNSFSGALAAIHNFSEGYIKAATKNMDKSLKADGKSISGDGSTGGAGARSTNFTSILHNLVDQMLLSIKSGAAADRAIEALKNGEKPVITVANTMGSAIKHYVESMDLKKGDRITLDFNELLERYLERSRIVSVSKPFMKKGEKAEKHRLTDEELGPRGVAAFNAAMEKIRSLDFSALPVSPIDHIHKRLAEAGYTSGEITGRTHTIEYRKDGTYYQIRPNSLKSIDGRRKTISDFNNGEFDALVINQAGASGLSLHASETFKNQNKRRMIIAQAEGNIDTHMQMLGRVHRTGQVVVPEYDQLVADVPAEKRPAAVLAKKMASLNANTTASRGGALTAKDVPDFMNQYGDEVAARVMLDMPEVDAALGNPISKSDTDGDAMRKVTGRIPLLPIADQEAVYEILESEYNALLEQKEAAGESVLEARTLALDAKTLEREQVVAPIGQKDSPFADGVYVEVLDVKRLGKPHPTETVIGMVAETLGLDASQVNASNYQRTVETPGRNAMQELLREAQQELTAYRRDVLDEIAGEKQRTAAENKLSGQMDRIRSFSWTAPVGQTVRLVTDQGNFYGVVTKITRTGKAKNPVALGSWKVTFAMTDASKQLTIPLSQLYTRNTEPGGEFSGAIVEKASNITPDISVIEAFDKFQTETREQRTIITGNLLAGFDHVGGRGSIINFTDDKGDVRQGILMPKDYDYKASQKDRPVDFRTAHQALAFVDRGHTVYSRDEAVEVSKAASGVRIEVAASKARGGRYYLDRGIREAIGRDFVKVGDKMRADISRDRALPALEELKRAGAGFQAISNRDTAREIVGGDQANDVKYARRPATPWYFSQLSRAAQGLPQEKGQPKQMLAMLKKQPGVKQEEIGWTGIEEYLNALEGAVTKQQIVDFLDANGVQVEEAVLRGQDNETDQEIVEAFEEQGYSVEWDDQTEGFYFMDEDGNDVDFDILPDDLQGIIEHTQKRFAGEAQYEKYTQPGGRNYREVLLTLPVPPAEVEYGELEPFAGVGEGRWEGRQLVEGVQEMEFTVAGFSEPGRITYWPKTYKYRGEYIEDGPKWVVNHVQLQNAQYRSLEDAKKGIDVRFAAEDVRRDIYRGGHFTQPNVIAHFRVNDRTGPNGEKILFVEEVQADKEKARKQGDKAAEALPFQKNAWVELVMKRIIRMAAEGGYDRVAWTTGEMQADRYDLAKQVDSIEVSRQRDYATDTYTYYVDVLLPKASDSISVSTDESGKIIGTTHSDLENKHLSDVVGKDLAEKFLAVDAKWPQKKVFEGADLKVGGEGMKSFYNRLIPNTVRKVAKKLDKSARVEVTEIADGAFPMRVQQGTSGYEARQSIYEEGQPWYIIHNGNWGQKPYESREAAEADMPQARWGVAENLGLVTEDGYGVTTDSWVLEAGYGIFDTKEEAQERLEEIQERRRDEGQVLSIPITDKMQAAAMEGMPLFSRPMMLPKARADAIEADLRERLREVGIDEKVGLEFIRLIDRDSVGSLAKGEVELGSYSARDKVIQVALAPGMKGTLDHEVIHALRDLGLFKPSEWKALTDAAAQDEQGMATIRRNYRDLGLDEEELLEEGVAFMFQDWAAGKGKRSSAVRRLLQRIRDFFRALGNALRGNGFQTAGDFARAVDPIFQNIESGAIGRRSGYDLAGTGRPAVDADLVGVAAKYDPSIIPAAMRQEQSRQHGIPAEAKSVYSFTSHKDVTAHKDHAAAKAGDMEAAVRLVRDLVNPATVPALKSLGDVIYVAPHAEEAGGRNKIPQMMARYYAEATGARADTEIIQASRAFHTGAKPLERIMSRPTFDGPVEPGGRYVLVDDVTVLGGTLAELANHIISNGGEVVGVVTLANNARNRDIFTPTKLQTRLLENRLGQEIRQFGIEPAALTGEEAQYLVGFRDVEQLRASVAKARQARNRRLREAGVRPERKLALRRGDFDPERARASVEFDNPETERRWQEARKGVRGGETMLGRAKAYWETIANGFARHYVHLPNTTEFADAREQLRKVEAAPQVAKEDALRALRIIVDDLSPAELDLFTRKVVLEDLTFEVSQEHLLPFGMTADDVSRELAKIDAALPEKLRRRAEYRNRLVKRVAQEMVRAGVLTEHETRNPNYYRHQVLDYARANYLAAQTPGKKLKAPYWARRMGSQLDINANLLEAEFEWMQKALTDVAVADTIEWFKRSEYNQRENVVAAAREHNKRLVERLIAQDMAENGYTKSTGRQTSPLNEQWVQFKQRIAMGLRGVREALEARGIENIPAQYRATAESLLYEDRASGSIFPLLAWMIDSNAAGARGAAMTFKAINQRKAWVRAVLGEKYADPMDIEGLVKRGFAPEGYKTWQPEDGKLLFTAKTIPEHAMDRMLQVLAETDGGPVPASEMQAAYESVRTMLVVGGPKYQLVLPGEIVETLNSLRDEHGDGIIDAVFAKPLALWKRWVLINPRRVIKYNLNNLSGDLDAVIAGNPKAIKKMPRAIKELYQVMIQGKTPSPRYREAVERGVFDSGLTIQEIPDINYMAEFEHLVDPPGVTQPIQWTKAKLLKVWRALQRYTWFRENWLRYAAYLDYVERLEAGESMQTIGYGAAKRDMVDGVTEQKDKAALLARELVGDYGAISHFGSHIRRKLIPFYSWMEINTKRYWRFGINAWSQGVGQGFRTTGVIGAVAGVRLTAYLHIRMAILYGLVQLWNHLLMGDEEDELSAEERVRLHIILGRDSDGKIRTLRFQGALSDYLQWIGFEDAVAAIMEVEKGRADVEEVLTTIAKAPVNRIGNSLTPLISAPVETMSGKKFWPDIFRPRLIRDKWRNIAQLFSVEHEYDLVFDKPSRGYGQSIEQAVVYKRDVGENSYNRVKGMTYDWLRREKGLTGAGGFVTPRSTALYEWRKAKRFGDEDAARKAYEKMRELGISGDDLRASVRRAHPLGAVSVRDRGAFLSTLTADERDLLDMAIQWYEETYID